MLHCVCLDLEDGGSKHLWKVSEDMVSHLRQAEASVIVIVIYFMFKWIQIKRSAQPLGIECVTVFK
jgi:hypothetical protein